MSGTKKPSNKNSKEVEIPIDEPEEIVIKTPKITAVDPEYFECDGEYTIFDGPD